MVYCLQRFQESRFEATIQSDFPTVGDFVMLDRCNNKNGNAIIHHVLHRKACLCVRSLER